MHWNSRRVRTAIITGALFISTAAVAADWPRWLGPDQNGTSPEEGIFGAAAPALNVAWSRALGKAYSGIAVVDGKAVTMFADGETDWLTAMDATHGKELWRYRIDEMFPKIGGSNGGQLGMPVVDHGIVYGLGARGQIFAVRLEDGSEVWTTHAVDELGGKQPHFGFTTTPLVVGDLLFVQTGGEDGHSLTGLARNTGKVRWSTGDEAVGYQSPIVTELFGQLQIVAVTNTSVSGIRPEDGQVLWSHEHGLVDRRDGWSTPILIGDDSFVLTGGAESAALQVSKSGDELEVKELWRGTSLKGNFAMPVLHGEHLYGFNGDFLSCVHARTGEQTWKHRSDAAGLILVDEHLVIFDSSGDVVIGAASSEGFEEKSRVNVSEKGGYTFPSFSDGGIFVRNLTDIARVNVGSMP